MKCYSYTRFSTVGQAKGTSKQRQVEAARKYAEDKGWDFDEAMSMTDEGFSGYHKLNTEKGELGVFLEAVRQGQIATPSALIVENLDRLSRADVVDQLEQFIGLIKAGIVVVTLTDMQVYDLEAINDNYFQLLISISIMARSHEESATKAKRRKATWEIDRNKVKMVNE